MPLPGTLFLLALGSFVEQGDLELRDVLLLSLAAVTLGDQIGYLTGQLAGRRAVDGFARHFERGAAIRRAEAFSARWDAPGIFFTRWVVAYVSLGRLFHDRIQDFADLLTSIGWLLLALVILVASGWELTRQLRRAAERARAAEASKVSSED